MSRIVLLLLAGLLLVACFAGSLQLLRIDERLRRARGRRLTAIAPYSRVKSIIPVSAVLSLSLPTASLGRSLRRCIGMDPNRPDPYPLSPWLVLPLAVLPGWAVRWLLHGLLGPVAWLLLPVCWIICVRSVYRGSDAKRTATLLKQFPDALGTIARAVRVGIPIAEAMRAVARDAAEPTAGEFARVHDQVTIGTPLEDALRKLAVRSRLPEYRFFATALSLQSQTGGGLTETLDNLADVIRKRVALESPRLRACVGSPDEFGRAGSATGAVRLSVGGAKSGIHRPTIPRRSGAEPVRHCGRMAELGVAGHARADPQEPVMTPLLPTAAAFSLLASAGSLLLLRALRRHDRLAARLLAVRLGVTAPIQLSRGGNGPLKLVATIGTALARSGLLSTGTPAQLEQTLTGIDPVRWTVCGLAAYVSVGAASLSAS